MGTVNVLQAARHVGTVKAIVNITTDKCYENKEWLWPYRENDRLGGYDAYSASKACAEIAGAAYRNSFLADANIHLASARAGNVIGGGDWAIDRLLPDFLRALDTGKTLAIRSPTQFVLGGMSLDRSRVISCLQKSSTRRQRLPAWNLAQMTMMLKLSVGLWINYVLLPQVRSGKPRHLAFAQGDYAKAR